VEGERSEQANALFLEGRRLSGCDIVQCEEGSCECGNEPSGSIKCWEILEWLE
jgi:hypothetical protein